MSAEWLGSELLSTCTRLVICSIESWHSISIECTDDAFDSTRIYRRRVRFESNLQGSHPTRQMSDPDHDSLMPDTAHWRAAAGYESRNLAMTRLARSAWIFSWGGVTMLGRSSSSIEGWPISESLLGDTEPDADRFDGGRAFPCACCLSKRVCSESRVGRGFLRRQVAWFYAADWFGNLLCAAGVEMRVHWLVSRQAALPVGKNAILNDWPIVWHRRCHLRKGWD